MVFNSDIFNIAIIMVVNVTINIAAAIFTTSSCGGCGSGCGSGGSGGCGGSGGGGNTLISTNFTITYITGII